MQRLFRDLCELNTPKVNPVVMDGLACVYLNEAEVYVDSVFKSASKSFPAGLEYIGYQRCTPQEEFEETTRPKNNKRTFDLARSDLYLVKYHFRYLGEDIPPRHIYLPFVGPGGIIYLGGSCFHITPVLSNKVISPGFDSIFVRLLRDKVTFKRTGHSIIVDSQRETSQVVWSQIYRKPKDNKKIPPTTRANTCLVHYLLARYGFSGMFTKYAGFVPVIGEEEITTELYPKESWVICESAQIKPKSFIGDFYDPVRIRLVIPRDKWNPYVQSLVAGFYYTVDHFPSRFKPSYVDNTKLWMILLGHIIFSGLFGENKLYTSIEEHFVSLNEYVDTIVIMKLKENGHHIEDFYDLLVLMLRNFNEWIVQSGQNNTSMYGKTLEVLYYVMYDITAGIFRTNFRLSKLATKKALTAKDIIETFNKQLKMGAIYGLSSGKIVAASVAYSGDHKYPKITSVLAEQESLPGASRGRKRRKTVGEGERIHTSMVEAGSMLFLSKSNPTPAARCNPFLYMDMATATIIPKPKFEELRARTDQLFRLYVPDDAKPLVEVELE